MAIKKIVTKDNGVSLSYHRISMIKVDVNQQITILVESYIDENGRNYEKQYSIGEIKEPPIFPYTDSEYFHIDYDEKSSILNGMIIQNSYEWLKNLPEFTGAEDI